MRFLVSVESRFEVFIQNVGVVSDGSQASFDVVGCHVSIRKKLFVSCLQFVGVYCKIPVRKTQLLLCPLALGEFQLQLFGCLGQRGRCQTFYLFPAEGKDGEFRVVITCLPW